MPELLTRWFEKERGITSATLGRFGVELRPDGAVNLPYPSGFKTRKGLLGGDREFYLPKGQPVEMYMADDSIYPTMFICEGETDTMRLQQELWDHGVAALAVGLPGISSWKSEWAEWFEGAANVFVILDNDKDPYVKATVDGSWLKIRKDLGGKVKRIQFPPTMQAKDVCEFFQQGNDLDDLRSLAVKPVSRFKALDLSDTYKPRPVNWMIEGLVGQGDITIMVGDPNVGKSWLAMALGVALAQGQPDFLGYPLHNHGRVLIIDEENPEDVVYNRLFKLGLTNADLPNLRYLHDQGIRLDRDPDAMLEEAEMFGPTLIIIDSMTRVHTEDENNAGAMSRLFNDGIKPLSRKTGATVLLLHHKTKSRDGSSYTQMRGSADIGAGIDTGLDVTQVVPGFMQMKQFKSRRQLPGPAINIRLEDTEDGHIRLVSKVEPPNIF